ncbi:portal protein [Mycobacterium phage Colt]|nr:portal protein [Mycobacterium phage Colt]
MSSPIYKAGSNWSAEVNRLRKAGVNMPNSPTMARAQAAALQNTVDNKPLIDYFQGRRRAAEANRQRLASYRKQGNFGSNMQIAMPKIRQPLGTLADKGIPFNVEDEEELRVIRHWCRLFYATHDLVPLLIDIYSKFPVVGMEFDSKDPLIKTFYEDLFFGEDLNYLEFLPDQFAREYFTVGEVTSLAHFNESLGVWSSEEILNPDMLRVSRSMFVQRERVQLMVKDLVDHLRQGPTTAGGNMSTVEETPSEREQRMREFQDLQRRYPEIIQAAMQNDGLDISEALISRVVNRPTAWATRGAPHLLRSFRTLMAEESLNAAQDAVADRLYSPLVLATLGIEDMGDGEPWIPDQGELDEVRDDMQSLLAADFRLMVHNFGLKVENVFGRESVPNLDADYDRIERKLLQAWGIGEALISGGTGGAYASSALNREFVTQIMTGFQNALKRHIRRRCEVVAEAQGHYDYDLKGGVRVPIYREIVEYDEETGQEYIRKVPKLLIPEIKFSCVVPGTQVLTPEGQRNVEDIRPGDEVIAWDGTGYVVDTALHTGIEHRDELVEVITKTGRTIRCTADHPFWTDQGWVKAQDLTDEIAIRTSAGQLAAQVETEDDPDLLRFLGLLVGDGNYSTTHVSLSVSDLEVDRFVCEQAERMGLTARRKADARTDKVWYRTFVRPAPWKGNALHNPLHKLLREQGMWGKNGHQKRVPPIVWAAGEKGRAAFLSGYFDADGYACRTSGMKLTSVNRALLDDCQVLFESLGIRAQVRSYRYRYEGQKNPGMQSVNHLTVSNNHYFQMLRDHLSPLIGTKIAALEDMARPSGRGRKAPLSVKWDRVVSVTPIGGGDIVTLGITETHTHVTAGLVSHNTLNLRDEAQERAFIAQLKGMGVPVSDKTLAVNIDMKFDQELERQADETVQKLMATAQAMKKVQDLCDAQNLPYPPELAQHLQSTLALRQGKTQTELGEAQAVAGGAQAELQTKQIEMQEMMMDQQMAGGVMPGQPMLPPGAAGPPPGAPGDPAAGGPPPPAGGPMGGPPVAPAPGVAGPGNAPASFYAASLRTADAINGPTGTGPSADGPLGPTGPELPPGVPEPTEVPRNRQRPAESDDNHPGGNLKPASRNRKRTRKGQEEPRRLTRWEKGPSSYGKSKMASEEHVVAQIRRREVVANWDWSQFGNAPRVADLVADPHFYQATNMQAYQGQLQADWPEIQAGGAEESRRILDDMLSQFQEIFGVEPQW